MYVLPAKKCTIESGAIDSLFHYAPLKVVIKLGVFIVALSYSRIRLRLTMTALT